MSERPESPMWRVKRAKGIFPDMRALFPATIEAHGVKIYQWERTLAGCEAMAYQQDLYAEPGMCVQLQIDGIGWMYDTPLEKAWNLWIVDAAEGECIH